MSYSMPGALRECIISDNEILRYRLHGSGPRQIVLVHGLAARAETWTDLLRRFPAEEYTVVAVDLLGSGESSKPQHADYSIRGHCRRLLLFLDRGNFGPVILVGHSLGGAVGLLAAIEGCSTKPNNLLQALVVIGGPGFLQRLPLIARVFRSRIAGGLFVRLPAPQALVRRGLRAAYHDTRLVDPEHIARYRPCYRGRDTKRALVATCRQLIPPDCDEIAACYQSIDIPVLLLWGRHDRIVPLTQGRRLEEAIPDARLAIVEGCGHNPQEESPDETFMIIDTFITGLS